MAKVVFAVYDDTTRRVLEPVASRIRTEVSVEYLYLHELLPRSSRGRDPTDGLEPGRNAMEYCRSSLARYFNRVERPTPIPEVVVQRLLEDCVSPRLFYDIDGFLSDVDPDVFVCGHDLLPFVKHLIRESHRRQFTSVLIQHGINRPRLEDPDKIPGVPGALSPTRDPPVPALEKLKRRVGFRYGAFLFCNPYLDRVYTLGEYFTDHISGLREEYPCFGKTDVLTAGSTEFNPETWHPYEATADSALFLSQWQFENGKFDVNQQRWITDRLQRLERENEIPVTVRPHPKDTESKIDRFFEPFDISRGRPLRDDIDRHDVVMTVDSTALFRAALAGKGIGVVHPPESAITFPPFTHEHAVQVSTESVNLEEAVSRRSSDTQREYLQEFCFVPTLDEETGANTPVEFLGRELVQLARETGGK